MASANITVEEDSFLSHAERVYIEIREKFVRAHQILQNRETDLLAELQRLVDEYTGAGMRDEIQEISDSKAALLVTLMGNQNRDILEQSLALLDGKMKKLEINHERAKYSYRRVSLQWDEGLEQRLGETGEIRVNVGRSVVPDYSRVDRPVRTYGRLDENDISPGVFGSPGGIFIDPVTNYRYVCDVGWNRVQVFNKSFEFMFLFNQSMNEPVYICIKENKVYVTQYVGCCMNIYYTKGDMIGSVGKKGNKELEFDSPAGLDVSTEMNRIYIAEYDNDRVQCLNLDLTFNSFIEDIFGAFDVKLTSFDIVVLSYNSPCISLYNYAHQSIRHMITRGEGCQVVLPDCICLDAAYNILISDLKSHCVCVFSHDGVLIHKFGKEGELIKPRGIAIDSEGRIIVATDNPEHCIQMF